MHVVTVSFLGEPAAPVLLGQADAFTDPSGTANSTSLILSAAPGQYHLVASLPDITQVTYLSHARLQHVLHARLHPSVQHAMMQHSALLSNAATNQTYQTVRPIQSFQKGAQLLADLLYCCKASWAVHMICACCLWAAVHP